MGMAKKSALFGILALIILVLASMSVFAQNATTPKVDLYFFYGKGCPHCAKMEPFLDQMSEKYSYLNIIKYEVYFDQTNRELMQKMAEAHNGNVEGVPTVFINNKMIVGFSDEIAKTVEQEIVSCYAEICKATNKTTAIEIKGESSPKENPAKTEAIKKLTIPAVIAAAFVDALNPCEFAVLIILISSLIATGNRKRAFFAGLAFTAAIYISYLLMGLGLFSAIHGSGISRGFMIVIAALAILVGLFNLKDWLWYGKWFVMEVPLSWRPAMKRLLKSVTSIPGAFLIGFVISLFLLPCTSGPYILILSLLAQSATQTYAVGLLLLYNLIFVAPQIVLNLIITLGATTAEEAERWRTKRLRVLHLISGIVILILGIGIYVAMALGML